MRHAKTMTWKVLPVYEKKRKTGTETAYENTQCRTEQIKTSKHQL